MLTRIEYVPEESRHAPQCPVLQKDVANVRALDEYTARGSQHAAYLVEKSSRRFDVLKHVNKRNHVKGRGRETDLLERSSLHIQAEPILRDPGGRRTGFYALHPPATGACLAEEETAVTTDIEKASTGSE